MIKFLSKISVLIFLLQTGLISQNNSVVINNIEDEQIYLKGFTLDEDKEINIKAVGTGQDKELKRIHNFQEDKHNMYAYAWILDARSRKMVWRMTIGNTEDDWWNKDNRVFKNKIKLPKGEYELYFSAVEPKYFSFESGYLDLDRIIGSIFDDDEWRAEHKEKWKVEVNGVANTFDEKAVQKYQRALKNSAIISLTEIEDTEYLNKGFSLSKDAKVRVYAIGEGFKKEMFDKGWIIDAETRDKVWEMKEEESEYAGGAIKNRVVDETIKLNKGDYLVYYKTDDNHSYNKWNANPPYDPNFWGITVFPSDENFDKSIVTEYTSAKEQEIVVLNRLGDDVDVSEGFTLTQPTKVRVYAIGEGRDGEMFDYGWIEDAKTGKRVWTMRYKDTEDAGGTAKNRLYDGIIKLDKGSYIVHFETDDSHSYEDWNSDEPYDPEGWGIQVFSTGKNDIKKIVKKYDPQEDENIIVKLIRVGDDEHVRKQFTLKKNSKIRIYALGEGDWDEMYDYGWIENFDTGEIVWEMEYSDTRRAGGDSKNRLYDQVIRLKAGNYIAHYQTDDSHAYRTWNKSAPRDRTNWGITIYLYNEN
jgi:hypothetical protein